MRERAFWFLQKQADVIKLFAMPTSGWFVIR
jgi:hypothetical protein